MKKLLLSVAALILATLLLSLDDSNKVDKDLTQGVKVEKKFDATS